MKDLSERPSSERLLEAFLNSERSEKAFTKLVDALNGLVFTSALRRTGSRELAKEVTQRVFAILARKAGSLRRHPALLAWMLETTRLESAAVVRAEARRRRKAEAFAIETKAQTSGSQDAMNQDPLWKDAVPVLDEALDRLPQHERKAVLQRFYEGKKFREMAKESGQTEAACKMRVKRAMTKLSAFLTARGVTLSVVALAAGLSSELARAASIKTASLMASKALAASSLSTTAIIANTTQTMSNFNSPP